MAEGRDAAALPGAAADHWAVEVLGGAAAGMAGVVAGQPLDTAKVRLQSPRLGFTGVGDCIWRTAREEGVRALYKGMAVPLSSQIVIQAVVFGSYAFAERQLSATGMFANNSRSRSSDGGNGGGGGSSSSNYWALFLAGSFAGLVQTPLMTAVEAVKIKLQLQRGSAHQQFAGPFDCARQLVRTGGLRALFPGFFPTLVREVPSYGIYFFVYEYFKRRFRSSETGVTGNAGLLMAGGLSGCASWAIVHPVDVLKTAVLGAAATPAGAAPASLWQVVRQNVRAHGWQWLTRGFAASQQRSFVVNAATFCCFEHTSEFVRSRMTS